MDASGTIRFVNAAASDIFGYAADELVGSSLSDWTVSGGDLPPDTPDDIPLVGTLRFRRRGGSTTCAYLAFPIPDIVKPGRVLLLQDAAAGPQTSGADPSGVNAPQSAAAAPEPDGPVVLCTVFDGIIRAIEPNPAGLIDLQPGDRFEAVFVNREDGERLAARTDQGEAVTIQDVAVLGPDRGIRRAVLSALPAGDLQPGLVFYWLMDVTSLRKTEQDLVRAKEQAEQATRTKSSFLARMSHEIRTPMNAIIGMSYLIRQSGLSPQQMEHLDKIQAAADSLAELINDILEFSTLESGQAEASRTRFLLDMLLESALSEARETAGQRSLGWVLDVAPDVPECLVGDGTRLGKILGILANNALKFTNQGSITIEVRRESADDDPTLLHFTVRDTGIGMTPDQLEHIFHSFTQADGSLTRRYGGTGLGLSLASHLVDLLGGRMWAESTAGQGSAFHCLLPFSLALEADEEEKPGPAAALEPGTGPARTEPLTTPRILLVEDNEINQEIACELLGAMHLDVQVAENGAEAVKAVEAERFDMIFMDIQMPVMDGLEATRRIRALDAAWAGEVPIIAMTAHALSDDREQSLAAGMNAHLTKPINPEALQRVVAIWLPDSVLLAPQEAEPEPVTEETPSGLDLSSLHGINITSGISNVAGNEALYLDLLRRFGAKYRDSDRELPELVNAYETESAVRLAHTIKGVAANLGATRLAGLAKDIENAILSGEAIADLLPAYAGELAQVTLSIDQLIASRDARHADPEPQTVLDPGAVPGMLQMLDELPQLMQTDWGQAQEKVESLGERLAHTQLADSWQRLRNALEEFDIVDFGNTVHALKSSLQRLLPQ